MRSSARYRVLVCRRARAFPFCAYAYIHTAVHTEKTPCRPELPDNPVPTGDRRAGVRGFGFDPHGSRLRVALVTFLTSEGCRGVVHISSRVHYASETDRTQGMVKCPSHGYPHELRGELQLPGYARRIAISAV